MNDTPHALSSSRTLWELVTRRAALTPDRPLFLQDGRTLTFEALRARAERVAAGLYGMGVRPGTVVAWQLPTRIETVVLSFALARLGAVQSPVIPFYRDREVGFALRESKAEFFAVPGVWRGFDHTEMARRLVASREKVNRKLHEWVRQGWVEIASVGVRLKVPDRLRTLAGGLDVR